SALAATLVGVAEYYTRMAAGTPPDRVTMTALGFEIMLGCITVAGTIVAAGKLQEWLPSRPLTYKGQNLLNGLVFLGIIALLITVIADPTQQWAFYSMIGVALLNSYSGLASCATGFAIGNVILIISGSLDGSSGFILSVLMSKAMNRSFTNVLFGAFASEPKAVGDKSSAVMSVRSIGDEDAAIQLAYAQLVNIIPGYD